MGVGSTLVWGGRALPPHRIMYMHVLAALQSADLHTGTLACAYRYAYTYNILQSFTITYVF